MTKPPTSKAAPAAKRLQLDKDELFASIGYQPHPGQWLVHRSTAPRRVLACGVRWGKTTCAQFECIAALMEPREESLGWVVAPDYSHSERIFQRVALAMQRHFSHRVKQIDLRDQRLVVVNFGGGKSELRGKSADNPISLLGEGLDYLVLDEAARLKESIWFEHLAQRLIDRKGWALLLSTPSGCNWFFQLYKRGQKHRDPQFQSWQSPSWTNPHLDRELIEAERERLASDVYREQYSAEFIGLEAQRCDTCGGPSAGLPAMILVSGDAKPPTCADCGDYVNAKGRTIVGMQNGRRSVTIISLRPRPDGSECIPEIHEPPASEMPVACDAAASAWPPAIMENRA